ncbi:MAG: cytochrome c [Acidobacteria bacterium]|nr:cytochrome c [Acidobacteriota bacterium]
MTEIPEHLLARSRERRAALGLGGGEGAAPPAAASSSSGDAGGGAVAPVAAAAAPAPVEAPPPPPPPPYVQAALRRPRVPLYAAPVLALLPVWAFLYFGLLTPKPTELDPQLAEGRDLYAVNCSGCHGAAGEGGTGRPLNEVLKTFPKIEDHLKWVHQGDSALPPGTPYGDPAQGRKAHTGGFGVMPAFAGALTDDQIAAIVRYERVEFGGEDPTAEAAGAEGTATPTTAGH